MSKDDLQEIINYYGEPHQQVKLLEELGEFLSAMSRFQLGLTSFDEVKNELADVLNMLEQFKIINNISDEDLLFMQRKKVERTLNYIKEKKDESN